MRRHAPGVASLLAAAAAWHLASGAAFAQVGVDQRALDALQPPAGTPASRAPAPRRQAPAAQPPNAAPARPGSVANQASIHPVPQRGRTPQPTQPAAPQRPAAPPVVPPGAPPVAAIPPPAPVPTPRPVPPPPVPVVDGAPGEAVRIGEGLRVTFGPGSSDLNRATEAAMRELARAVMGDERLNVVVNAYAAGQPDDPSTPRRISLARVLAARAVLISEGIASTRILPRALGPNVPDGPADRVDLVPTPGGSATMPAPAALQPAGQAPGQVPRPLAVQPAAGQAAR